MLRDNGKVREEEQEINITIGKNLKKIMVDKNFMTKDLAEAMRLTSAVMSLKLNGKVRFTVYDLVVLCDILDLSIEDLLAGIVGTAAQDGQIKE